MMFINTAVAHCTNCFHEPLLIKQGVHLADKTPDTKDALSCWLCMESFTDRAADIPPLRKRAGKNTH